MTSALLPPAFFHPSMCSLAASPARTFPKPESELELTDLARAFGLSSPELLASFDPVSWSLRTSQGSLLQEEQWGECLETLPDSGMWDAGAVYELRSSEPVISESASSLWPTAASFNQNGGEPTLTENMAERFRSGRGHNLYEAVAATCWPTARQEDGESCGNHPGVVDSLTGATKLWGTPQAHERQADPRKVDHGVQLANQVDVWQTPATDSFRSRGGDRKDEQGLDQQARMFPTPAIRDYRTPNKRSYQDRSGTTKGEQLQNFVEHNFPASLSDPQIQDGQPSSESAPTSHRHWATPTDSMATMQDQEQAQTAGNSPNRPKYANLEKRRLNPRFVEWLMGFPLGWTERCKTAPSD
jgi:hypothetical protein